jgi:hypothetical protein
MNRNSENIPGNNSKKILAGGALVMATIASLHAQQQPFMQAGTAQPSLLPAPPKISASASTGSGTNSLAASTKTSATASTGTNSLTAPTSNPIDKLFNGKIPDAIAKGKVNVNVRLRYEQVDEEGVAAIKNNSYAPTIRTRLGYTTAPLYGFQAMVEGVNVSAIGPEQNYNAAGSNKEGTRPVVADPPMTRVDQAWVGYSYTNWISTKVGQQPINLDNQRFIGDVGWRQNIQTFDAVSVGSEPLKDFKLYYSYLWYVNRVFGNVDNLPAANRDFDSNSHLINVSYSGWKYGRFVGYTYLLDLNNDAGAANSCATYGGYFAGNAPINDTMSADYRAEFAWQTQYGDSTLDYGTEYYNLEGGVNIKPFAVGAGYEDLGSGANTGAGGGRASFRTPLATLHAFNGWNDVFLTTPADGLRDLYGYAQVILPAQIPLRFVYHKYNADYGGGNYGQEFDLVASKKFGKYWTATLKYAYYQGQDPAAPSLTVANVDIQKLWAQIEFNF